MFSKQEEQVILRVLAMEAISTLTMKQRLILLGPEMGIKNGELATILGISKSDLHTRRWKIRKKLRKWAKMGGNL
jgi:DNA-directed RNA polymerase specialized sigma24 family protein